MVFLSGWGHYPIIAADLSRPAHLASIRQQLNNSASIIGQGHQRSYGDSALAQHMIRMTTFDRLLDFNPKTGVLICEAGISLQQLLAIFVPRGWFLPITPGTSYISMGGAIASDIHGKNHHLKGCFSECLYSFSLMIASGDILECSRTQNAELFYATCGGMGLTGIILTAHIQLKAIQSAWITETQYSAHHLNDLLDLFEAHHQATYSVAWIDTLAQGTQLGRSILMLGEHSAIGSLTLAKKNNRTLPINLPIWVLNRYSISAFNQYYFYQGKTTTQPRQVPYQTFFYPLDTIQHWYRLYGKNGFIQYQFVVPKAAGRTALTHILTTIHQYQQYPFLSVLKAFGPANQNYLSFPMEGYTLALDFKLNNTLLPLLDILDAMVLSYGGRLYLAKDARMSETTFKNSYPEWEKFQRVRHQWQAHTRFNSVQSRRIGL